MKMLAIIGAVLLAGLFVMETDFRERRRIAIANKPFVQPTVVGGRAVTRRPRLQVHRRRSR
jgi:hypothetical protein